MADVYLPAGWPEGVPPPGTQDWELAAAWLLLRAPAQASARTAEAGTHAAVITVSFAVAAVGVLVPAAIRPALVIVAFWPLQRHVGSRVLPAGLLHPAGAAPTQRR